MPDQSTSVVKESQNLLSPTSRVAGRRLKTKVQVRSATGYEHVHTLEHIFTLVPLHFVFAQKDYSSLCCTSRCMKKALHYVPQGLVLNRKGYIAPGEGILDLSEELSMGSRVDSMKLHIPRSQTRMFNANAIRHLDTLVQNDRAQYAPVRVPSMPYLRFLNLFCDFFPVYRQEQTDFHWIPALDLSSVSQSLLELRIQSEDKHFKIYSKSMPTQAKFKNSVLNLDSNFPRLVSLVLDQVTCGNRKMVCPPTLSFLELQNVYQLYEIEFTSDSIKDLFYNNLPHLKLESFPAKVETVVIWAQPQISAEIPSSVRELDMYAHQFLTTNVPLSVESLYLEGDRFNADEYANENFDYWFGKKFLKNSYFGLVTSSRFTNLKKLDLDEVHFRQFVVPEGVQDLKWKPGGKQYPEVNDVEMNRITLPRSIRKLYVVSNAFYQQQNFVLPPYAEVICLSSMPNVKRLTIPSTCRTLVLYDFDNLKYLVFDGCKPTCIHLAYMEKLESIRLINGAVVPDNIPVPIDGTFHYGDGKFECFHGSFTPCEKFFHVAIGHWYDFPNYQYI